MCFLNKYYIVVLSLISLTSLYSQESIVTSGASLNEDVFFSYSIGQPNYIEFQRNSNVNQGVQQQFEVESNFDLTKLDLEVVIYPNPTVGSLIIFIENYNHEILNYKIFDVWGKLMQKGEISNQETSVNFDTLSSSIYNLVISTKNEEIVKSFQLIKK